MSTELSGKPGSNISLDLSGNLYFITYDTHNLISLAPDGTLRWELAPPGRFHNGWMPGTFSPDRTVFYSSTEDSLYALNTAGEIQWGYWTGADVFFSMVDNSGCIYFYNPGDSCITALFPSGDVRWRTALNDIQCRDISQATGPTIDAAGNLYFHASGFSQHGIVSLDNEGTFRWFWNGVVGTDLVSDMNSNLYFCGAADNLVTCYRLDSTGDLIWQVTIGTSGGMPSNCPALTNGKGYFPIVYDYLKPLVIIE